MQAVWGWGRGVEESWEHVWEECRTWRERGDRCWQEAYAEILGEGGEGEDWMREVEEERKVRKGEG